VLGLGSTAKLEERGCIKPGGQAARFGWQLCGPARLFHQKPACISCMRCKTMQMSRINAYASRKVSVLRDHCQDLQGTESRLVSALAQLCHRGPDVHAGPWPDLASRRGRGAKCKAQGLTLYQEAAMRKLARWLYS